MSVVVHHQRPVGHLLFDQLRHVGIGIARCRGYALVGIPVDLIHGIAREIALHHVRHPVGCCHVRIAVAVVAHHADHILPGTGIHVISIVQRLVYQHLRLQFVTGRETAYGHIGLTQIDTHPTPLLLDLLLIVEQTEEVVAHVAVHVAERVLALEAQQEVVRIIATPVCAQHTVIPGTVAEEQQVAGHVGFRLRPVVEHLHIAAVGRSIRRTAGEFIIQLVSRHDPHPQPVVGLVPGLDALCLRQHLLISRNDDHHVHRLVGMVVLIHDAIDDFRFREGCRLQVRHRQRGIYLEREIVQAQVAARCLGDLDGILFLDDAIQLIVPHRHFRLGIAVERYLLGYGSYHRVVHRHLCLEAGIVGECHAQRARCPCGWQLISLR